MIRRTLEDLITKYLFKGKTIIIYGARQVGKTTLLEQLFLNSEKKIMILNGDESDVRELLTDVNSTKLKTVLAGHELIIIDEAQRIPEPGLVLKIIHDNFKNTQLIATGSSAFELAGKIKEPMTGRKYDFFLHPLSFEEMVFYHGLLEEKRMLEHRMIYGYYPDIVVHTAEENKLLKTLTASFLYKDLLQLEGIKKPVLLEKILKALALQLGNEVSYHKLAQLLNSDKETIEKYIDLLEKAYLIFRLPAFSRNVRNEIKKGTKIYFYDNGIRNALLVNFLPLGSRSDSGALWENFIISERKKFLNNHDIEVNAYFWRTTQQQEIDLIEEIQGKISAYEFKLHPHKKALIPLTFKKAYPEAEYKVIHSDNLNDFILTNQIGEKSCEV